MATVSTIHLVNYVVRDNNGEIDVTETLNKFHGDLLRYKTERETERETMLNAVHSVFDGFPLGQNLQMDMILSTAALSMNAMNENFKVLKDKIHAVLKDESGDRNTGRKFGILKGKGGGVCRWVDVPEKENK